MTAKRVLVSFTVAAAAVGMYPVVVTQPGAQMIAAAESFLLYFSGVFSLIAFTGAVVWGLLAAERLVPVRYRVIAQGVHRMFGLLGLGFLVTHIVLQILAEHATAVDAVIPFLDTRDRLVATGLGTIAADLMVVVYAVGKLRGRFVNASRPWVWRIVHGISYLSWPIAITHGLTAGRPVLGSWVTVSYAVCLLLVVVALLIRLFSPFPAMRSPRRRPSAGFADERPTPAKGPSSRERTRRAARGGPGDRADRGDRRRPGPPTAPGRPRRGTDTGPLERVRPPEPIIPREPALPVHEAAPPSAPVPPFERTRPPAYVPPGPSGPSAPSAPSGPPVAPVRPVAPVAPVAPGAPVAAPGADPRWREPLRPAASAPPRAPEAQRERLLIPDRPDAGRPGTARPASAPDQRDQRGQARRDEERQPRHWLDAVERFPLFQWRPRRQSAASRPIVNPDIEEVEFWANLRAETSVWIRRGRR